MQTNKGRMLSEKYAVCNSKKNHNLSKNNKVVDY